MRREAEGGGVDMDQTSRPGEMRVMFTLVYTLRYALLHRPQVMEHTLDYVIKSQVKWAWAVGSTFNLGL